MSAPEKYRYKVVSIYESDDPNDIIDFIRSINGPKVSVISFIKLPATSEPIRVDL